MAILSAVTLGAGGCGAFFVCQKASCPTTGSGSTATNDIVYVSNSASGQNYLDGFAVSGGTLAAAASAPYNLTYAPEAMAVTPANTFLYIASDSVLTNNSGNIYGYSIASGGAITILDSGISLAAESVTSLDISPDGQWLIALDANGLTMEEYSINSTSGLLKYQTTYTISGTAGATVVPSMVRFAPSGDFLVVALGTAGAETFTFTTSTGVATPSTTINTGSSSVGIGAVAVDGNNYIYLAGTAGLQVFSANTSGVPSSSALGTYATGSGSSSIVISEDSKYVYVGNGSSSTTPYIYGFSIGSSGALTALTGSPYAGPSSVSSLVRDNSGTYIVAAGYNSGSGIQIFTIGSAGALTLNGSTASGTSTALPAPVAATH